MLEPQVAEHYYLSDKIVDTFLRRNEIPTLSFQFATADRKGTARAITTAEGGRAISTFIQDEKE